MQIELPQGKFFVGAGSSDPVLLVGGGRPPAARWLKEVCRTCPVWAIDRGIDVCRAAAVIPEILIGDADSGDAKSWLWAESLGVPSVRHPVDKDLTDLQLALQELGLRRPGAAAVLTGGLGRRFDHAYSNVFSLLESDQWGIHAMGLADEAEAVFLLSGGQTFRAELAELPATVSLLPLSDTCEDVRSEGVHWPLHGAALNLRHPGGISNRLAAGSRNVSVSLGSGRIGVYFCWKETGL